LTKKLCSAAGCNAIVDHNDDGTSPRCEKHKRTYKAKDPEAIQYNHHLNEKGQSIYSTWRWKKLRAAKVKLNPLCEHCLLNGIATPVKDVDHVIEIQDGGEIWDINNLQSLCRKHHIIKTEKCKAERQNKKDEFGYMIDTKKLVK